MSPNQWLALIIAVASVFGFSFTAKKEQVDDSSTPTPPPKPSRKKLTAFSEQVKTLIDACPYASPVMQIEYLLSGSSPQEITKREMTRLGEKSKSETPVEPS